MYYIVGHGNRACGVSLRHGQIISSHNYDRGYIMGLVKD